MSHNSEPRVSVNAQIKSNAQQNPSGVSTETHTTGHGSNGAENNHHVRLDGKNVSASSGAKKSLTASGEDVNNQPTNIPENQQFSEQCSNMPKHVLPTGQGKKSESHSSQSGSSGSERPGVHTGGSTREDRQTKALSSDSDTQDDKLPGAMAKSMKDSGRDTWSLPTDVKMEEKVRDEKKINEMPNREAGAIPKVKTVAVKSTDIPEVWRDIFICIAQAGSSEDSEKYTATKDLQPEKMQYLIHFYWTKIEHTIRLEVERLQFHLKKLILNDKCLSVYVANYSGEKIIGDIVSCLQDEISEVNVFKTFPLSDIDDVQEALKDYISKGVLGIYKDDEKVYIVGIAKNVKQITSRLNETKSRKPIESEVRYQYCREYKFEFSIFRKVVIELGIEEHIKKKFPTVAARYFEEKAVFESNTKFDVDDAAEEVDRFKKYVKTTEECEDELMLSWLALPGIKILIAGLIGQNQLTLFWTASKTNRKLTLYTLREEDAKSFRIILAQNCRRFDYPIITAGSKLISIATIPEFIELLSRHDKKELVYQRSENNLAIVTTNDIALEIAVMEKNLREAQQEQSSSNSNPEPGSDENKPSPLPAENESHYREVNVLKIKTPLEFQKLAMLQKFDFKSYLAEVIPKLEIEYLADGMKYKGDKGELQERIDTFLSEHVWTESLRGFPNAVLEFYAADHIKNSINDIIRKKGIICHWFVDNLEKCIMVSTTARSTLDIAKDEILGCVTFEEYTNTDDNNDVMRCQEIGSFFEQKGQNLIKADEKCETFFVIGFFPYVKEFKSLFEKVKGRKFQALADMAEGGQTQKSIGISSQVFKFLQLHKKQQLEDFLTEYKVQIKKVDEEIFLTGNSSYVEAAFNEFSKSKFVTKKWSCEVPNPVDIIEKIEKGFQQLESEFLCSLEVEPVVGNLNQQQLGQWVNWEKGLHIVMVYGKVCEISADVIVCPTTEAYEPSSLGKTIMKKGGNTVQLDFSQNRAAKTDEIFLSMETGDLFCIMLAHVAVPKSTSGDMQQKMISFLKNLLFTVDKTQQQSIAIPLKMSDQVPESTLVHWLILALKDLKAGLSNLKEIYLCSEDPNAAEADFDVLKQGFQYDDLHSYSFKHLFENPADVIPKAKPAKIDISLVKGNLIEQKVDVLVNSCGTDLNLSKGIVSRMILKEAGKKIQDDCNQRCPNGLQFGDVVITIAGKLQAKIICHCALPQWTPSANFSSQVLEKIVFESLMQVEAAECKTIAFPVFGTGSLLYPWESVAKTMITTIIKYGRMHFDTSVKEVRIVLYEKDLNSIEAFETRKAQAEQLIMRPEDPMLPPRLILESRCRKARVKVVPQSELRFHNCEALVNISFFQNEKDVNLSKLKTCEIDKAEGANYWIVKVFSDETEYNYKDAVKRAISCSIEQRWSAVAICLMHGQAVLPFRKQIMLVRDLVNEQKKNRYLQVIKLVILNRETFETMIAETQSKQEEESKQWTSIVAGFFHLKKNHWKVVHYSDAVQSPRLLITASGDDERTINAMKDKLRDNIEYAVKKDAQYLGSSIKHGQATVLQQKFENEWIRSENQSTGIKMVPLSSHICLKLEEAVKNDNPSVELMDGADLYVFTFGETCTYYINDQYKGISGKFYKQGSSSDPNTKQNIYERQASADECFEEVFGDISEELLKYTSIKEIEKAVRKDFQDVMLMSPVKKKFTFKSKSFDTLKKVNEFLKQKYGSSKDCLSFERSHSSDSNPQPPPRKKRDKGETTAPQNPELKVEMTVQQYDKLMFFCKDNIVRSAKHNGKELMLKVISQSDGTRYKDIVITEIKTIDQLSQVEIQLDDLSKKKEIEKVIADEFSDIYCKVYEKVVQLFGATYDSLQQAKHRLEIVLGTKHETKGRRGRRFADPSDNYTTPSRDDANVPKKPTNFPSESFSKSYNPSGGVSRSMEQSYSTPEGMTIKVYVGNILKLDVECIVNAANETLSHGGGVAAVISEAAGYQFDQESADYVRRYGPLPVGTCCSTLAGKLHYKYVIHTVGPRWYDYKHDEKKFCAMDLKQSIVCCFEEAEKLQLKSIALPSISAGIFGVPKEVCVAEYKNAVADFSRNSKGGEYLKEIHFIDKDLGLISLIQQEFNSIFQQSSKSGGLTSPVGKKDFRRSMSSGSNDEKFQQGASLGGNRSNRFHQSTNGKIGVYVVKQKLKLEVKTGDITKCEMDAIVCPQDEYLLSIGRIAAEVQKVCGYEYKDELLKLVIMKKTGAARMNAPRKCPWKYVIQAVPPRWNLDATRNPKGFEQNLKDTVFNILNATKQSRIKTLAVPLMGIAEKGETPVETFAEQFSKAVLKQVEDKNFTVEEIHVMVHDMNVVKKIVGVFDTKETEGIKKVLKSSHRSHAGRSEEAMEVDNVETGDVSGGCCICMDKLDNPKTLACGHVFCTECIEQQFKYKPSCPQCGQIHGVVTGTQPDGRMNIRTKKYSLPGYSGTNTIEIEYMIYSGKQGEEHPNPGRYFEGITRTAFLPETKKGKIVLKLLDIAFKRKLVFTIGISTTTGKTGVVTWNDIHHKTNPKPNTQFGYPDDTYLDRVLEELAAKGITEKDLQD